MRTFNSRPHTITIVTYLGVILVYLSFIYGLIKINDSTFLQILITLIFIGGVFLLIQHYWPDYRWMEYLASQYGLHYIRDGARFLREARFRASPSKKFFQARTVKFDHDTLPYLDGQINNCRLWLYSFIGVAPIGSYLNRNKGLFQNLGNVEKVENGVMGDFHGWILEIETHKIPLGISVHRKFISKMDKLDTESGQFEKKYHIDSLNGHGTLQLLDPVMIELIFNSNISALEFSDSSVVLYYTMPTPKKEVLENMLAVGLKIAEQVDRNFPLGNRIYDHR